MKFAYADPPYPGKSRKYYRDHPHFDGEVDHPALIARLEEEFPEGWALSTDMASLHYVLSLCPPPVSRGAAGGGVRQQYRVLSWCKPLAQPGGNPGPLYGWEPVILRGGRSDPDHHYPRDWIVANPELYTMRDKPEGYVTGRKPPEFCRWLFACAGLQPGDEFVDLFAGSGAVAAAWEAWDQQPTLGGQVRAADPPAEALPGL